MRTPRRRLPVKPGIDLNLSICSCGTGWSASIRGLESHSALLLCNELFQIERLQTISLPFVGSPLAMAVLGGKTQGLRRRPQLPEGATSAGETRTLAPCRSALHGLLAALQPASPRLPFKEEAIQPQLKAAPSLLPRCPSPDQPC